MGTSSKELAQQLKQKIKRQHGCFTAAQALEAGYADSVHLYHVKTGSWLRIYRGVYRLSSMPASPESRCMAALLWTRDKSGNIQGFLTKETAEKIKNGSFSENSPVKIGVFKGFRRSSSVPEDIDLTIFEKNEIKTSKFNGLTVQTVQNPGSIASPDMDAPDYYDWIDYQAVVCPTNP